MIADNAKPRWLFYLLWFVLTLLCIPIAFYLDLALLRLIVLLVGDFVYVGGVRHITEDFLALYVFIPIAGLVMGLVQYALLRRTLPQMGWWVAATLGGWIAGPLLFMIPGWFHWSIPYFPLNAAFVVLGVSIGLGQWLLLRRRLPRAGWWIAANAAGWSLLAWLIAGQPGVGQFGLWTLGILPACATAVALALLMNQGRRAEPQGA